MGVPFNITTSISALHLDEADKDTLAELVLDNVYSALLATNSENCSEIVITVSVTE